MEFMAGYFLAVVVCVLVSLAGFTADHIVTSGKQFKIGPAVYQCKKTQELILEGDKK